MHNGLGLQAQPLTGLTQLLPQCRRDALGQLNARGIAPHSRQSGVHTVGADLGDIEFDREQIRVAVGIEHFIGERKKAVIAEVQRSEEVHGLRLIRVLNPPQERA